MPGWRDRWYAARNRLVGDQRFQRWAARFPLTRRIATKRAGNLFDICAGFVYAQILFACVELRLLEKLARGPMSASTLATLCGLPPDAMRRLLAAAAPLGLVERRGGDAYGLGMDGAALLGNPAIGAMVAHHRMLYRDLADPVGLLRGETAATELSRFWPYATADAPASLPREEIATYSRLMSSSLTLVADDVLDAYPVGECSCLLDVGGGAGDFLAAAARRHRDLQVMLFDLPAVAKLAEARFAEERLGARARIIGGDFKRDPLPSGADMVSLVRVAHDLDDDALDSLLAKICLALPMNGSLLLAEPMADTPGAEKVGSYFAMYLLAMQRGRPRSSAELSRRLRGAGFVDVRAITTARPMLSSLIIARKRPA